MTITMFLLGALMLLAPPGALAEAECVDLLWYRLKTAGTLDEFARPTTPRFMGYGVRLTRTHHPRTLHDVVDYVARDYARHEVPFVVLGPRPATNIPGLDVTSFGPWTGLDSVSRALAVISRRVGPRVVFTLMLNLTGEGDLQRGGFAVRRLWHHLRRMDEFAMTINPESIRVFCLHEQMPTLIDKRSAVIMDRGGSRVSISIEDLEPAAAAPRANRRARAR